MLPELLLLLLLLVYLPFLPLLLEPATSPGLRVPSLVLEDGLVVDVLEQGHLADEGFTIVCYFLIELVVLQVYNCQLGHFDQNLVHHLLALDVVVRDIQGGNGRAL